MIKIDLKRWVIEVWRNQTWFGYTYVPANHRLHYRYGRWYKNSGAFMNTLRIIAATKRKLAND